MTLFEDPIGVDFFFKKLSTVLLINMAHIKNYLVNPKEIKITDIVLWWLVSLRLLAVPLGRNKTRWQLSLLLYVHTK